MIQEGVQVPEFEVKDASGKMVKPTDFKGKKHLYYFYPKDFTSGCTIQADEFAHNYENFKKSGIEIIGVSPDDVESHRKFCEKMNIKYVLLADTEKEISKAFGVWGLRKFAGKEYMGITRSTFLVDESGKIFKVFPNVKPAGHAKQVLEAFE